MTSSVSLLQSVGLLHCLVSLANGYVVTRLDARSTLLPRSKPSLTSMRMIGAGGQGDFMVREFSQYEELAEIVQLASQPIPERPDGIVCVAKYTSATRPECRATEPDYERLARANPATIFLRCLEEYENSAMMFSQADIQKFPTYDIFYGGNRVARVDGSSISELEEVIAMYQFQNSDLDLFSEDATRKRELKWGDGTAKDMNKTPRTTARFIPGYDWGSNKGFFDEQADKAQQSFEESYGNWVPNVDDE